MIIKSENHFFWLQEDKMFLSYLCFSYLYYLESILSRPILNSSHCLGLYSVKRERDQPSTAKVRAELPQLHRTQATGLTTLKPTSTQNMPCRFKGIRNLCYHIGINSKCLIHFSLFYFYEYDSNYLLNIYQSLEKCLKDSMYISLLHNYKNPKMLILSLYLLFL